MKFLYKKKKIDVSKEMMQNKILRDDFYEHKLLLQISLTKKDI